MGGYAIPPISSPPHFLRGGVGSLVSQRTKEPCRSEVLVFSCFLPTETYAHRPDKYDTIRSTPTNKGDAAIMERDIDRHDIVDDHINAKRLI